MSSHGPIERTPESALEPDLEICDPHHHLWDFPDGRYLADDLLADIRGGHRITKTVFVECTAGYRSSGPEEFRPVGETDFVRQQAESVSPREVGVDVAAGIVGYADLQGDSVRAVLEAHLASFDRFRGIRHAAGWDASPEVRNSHTHPPRDLYLDPTFRTGFAELAPLGLSFDAWLYHPQLATLVDLARAFPKTQIIVDHVGGPLGIGPYRGRRDEIRQSWQRSIEELSACRNVVVKLGGLGMPICGFDFHKQDRPPCSDDLAAAWKPYILHCIESFGVDRCMFESNFPVDRQSCSYTVLWNAFKRIVADASDLEKRSLFSETARRVYRLQVAPTSS